MVLHDQHVHSSYSVDSTQPVSAYYNYAKKLGCSYFVTTEHIDFDMKPDGKDWLVDFDSLIRDLNDLSMDGGPKPLLGVELGYQKKYIDRLNSIASSHNFDLINLSIHDSGECEYYFKDDYLNYGIDTVMNIYYNQMLDAVTCFDNFDVLSHMDYAYKTIYKMDHKYKMEDYNEIITKILKKLIEKGKALEINTKVQGAFTDDSHLVYLLKLYYSLGGRKITISSDAHKLERYLESFDKYKELAKSIGFTYLCYFVKRVEYHFPI